MALFQQSSGSGSGTKNLVEFKCGKMTLSGTTVTPDKRKGLLYIYRDECAHLCWKDRTSGKTEDDLMIFPNDAEFVPVPQCTTGRVFLLKFKESSKKLFFWMQEPDSKQDKDEDLMKKVNDSLNNPSSTSFHEGRSRRDDPEDALMQILSGSGNSQTQIQQLQSLLQQTHRNQSRSSRDKKETPSRERKEKKETAPKTESSTSAKADGVQLEDLQSILRNMAGNIPGAPRIDISEAMKPTNIIPLLADAQIREKLVAHLPTDTSIPKTQAELEETVRSPQFKQACDAFAHALLSGQLGPALLQFGVPKAAIEAANKGDVRAFAEAMEKNADEKTDDDQMQTE